MYFRIVIFLLLLSPITNNAQEYIIRNYRLDATTKNPSVFDISQDKYGFIWFSTSRKGIYRFDGKDFKYFSEAEGFSNDRAPYIRSDSKQNLWIATTGEEISLFRYDGKTFKKFILPEFLISPNFVEFKGSYWFTLVKGIYKFDGNNFNKVISRTTDDLYWLAKDSKGNLLILHKEFLKSPDGKVYFKKTLKLELLSFDGKNLIPKKTFPNYSAKSFLVDRNDNIWIGLEGKALKYDGQRFSEINLSSKYPDEVVERIVEDKTGDIWFSTKCNVYKVEGTKAKCIDIYNNTGDKSIIHSIFVDRDNNIWVGSAKSLTKINRNYFPSLKKKNELSDNELRSSVLFYVDSQNNKWFSNSRSIIKLDAENQKVFQCANPLGLRCVSGTEDNSGNFWFDNDHGLLKFDGKDTKIYLKKHPQITEFTTTNRLKFWNDGNLYLMGFNSILKFDGNFFSEYSNIKDSITYCSLLLNVFNCHWFISKDNNGKNKIISVYDGKKFRNIDLASGKGIHFAHPLLEDKNNIWIFITYGNDKNDLVQIEKCTLKLHRFNQNNGLPSGWIRTPIFDKSGNIWFLVKGKGFCRFHVNDYYKTNNVHFTSFPFLEGMQNEASNPLMDKQGIIWILSPGGWTKFSPSELESSKYIPEVKLSSVQLFFSSHNLRPYSIGEKNINGIPKSLTLPYNENHLTFEFSAPNFNDPEDVKYSYMLKGIDKQWSPLVGIDKVTYPSLSPGTYIFMVKAYSRDGLSGKEDQISFVITPPFWYTWWFILIVIIVFSAFIFIIIKIILQIEQKKKLEKLVIQRTKELLEEKEKVELQRSEIQKEKEKVEIINSELEKNRYQLSKINEFQSKWLEELSISEQKLQEVNQSKDKFFSIISHDLKSPVNAIIRFTDGILEQFENLTSEEIREYLESLNNSTKNVYHLVEDLLEWSRIQIGRMDFKKVSYNLSAQIKEMINIQSGNLNNKKIKLIEKIDDKIFVNADENMIRSVLHNLLSNAVKFTHENGTILLEAYADDNFAEVSVTDNGIGITHEELPKLFCLDAHYTNNGTAGEKGTGLGLILCKELIEKNDGSIYVESIAGKGSTFSFRVPLSDK